MVKFCVCIRYVFKIVVIIMIVKVGKSLMVLLICMKSVILINGMVKKVINNYIFIYFLVVLVKVDLIVYLIYISFLGYSLNSLYEDCMNLLII